MKLHETQNWIEECDCDGDDLLKKVIFVKNRVCSYGAYSR